MVENTNIVVLMRDIKALAPSTTHGMKVKGNIFLVNHHVSVKFLYSIKPLRIE